MDFNKVDFTEAYLFLLLAVDVTGKQQEGEFSEKERDPEVHAKFCEWLEEVRQIIIRS